MTSLTRRTFLRAAGVSLALPVLESLQPARLRCRQDRADSPGAFHLHAAGQARRLQPTLGARDREKVDEYFTSVRELEQRLVTNEEWGPRNPSPRSPPRRRRTT